MLTFSPDILEEGMRTLLLQRAIDSEPAILPVLCAIIDSNKAEEVIPFLGDVPQMTEWSGTRKITRLSSARYSVVPVKYQSTVAISRDHMADDQMGAIAGKIGQLAQRAANHPVVKLVDAMVQGDSLPCYDGSSFFGNTHPARGDQTTAQDNYLAGTGTSTANLQADLSTMRTYFRRVVDEANEPWSYEVSNLLIVAPPEMEQNFITVLFANTVSTGGQNMYQGMADLWVTPRLSDVNDWYGYNLGAGKPFVFVNRQGIQTSIAGMDPAVWMNSDEVKVGVDYRAGIGYLYWQVACKFVN